MGIIRSGDRSLFSEDFGFGFRSVSAIRSDLDLPIYFALGGAAIGTTSSFSVTWPTAHKRGDLGIIVVERSGDTAATAPTGWTAVSGSPVISSADAAGTYLGVFWKFAQSSSESSVEITQDGDHYASRLFAFRGVRTDVPPGAISASDTKTVGSTSATYPSITTQLDNCLVLLAASHELDSATNQYTSTPVNANLSSLTLLSQSATSGGNGGGFGLWMGTKATAGSTGTTTRTLASTVVNSLLTFALEPRLGLPY